MKKITFYLFILISIVWSTDFKLTRATLDDLKKSLPIVSTSYEDENGFSSKKYTNFDTSLVPLVTPDTIKIFVENVFKNGDMAYFYIEATPTNTDEAEEFDPEKITTAEVLYNLEKDGNVFGLTIDFRLLVSKSADDLASVASVASVDVDLLVVTDKGSLEGSVGLPVTKPDVSRSFLITFEDENVSYLNYDPAAYLFSVTKEALY